MEDIVIRQVENSDHPFIINSWLKSYKGQSPFTEFIPGPIFYKWHTEIINRILARDTCTALIAASRDESDVIVGYLIAEKIRGYNIAHYVYVKRAFNGFGICRMLFNALPKIEYSSHMTRAGKPIIEKLELKYCPYFIFI